MVKKLNESIIVIGGGITGSSVAYELASRGVNVTLVEGLGIGQSASGNALGLLNPIDNLYSLPSSMMSDAFLFHMDMWKRLEDETRMSFNLQKIDSIKLHFEDENTAELFQIPAGLEKHFSIETISPNLIKRIDSRINDQVSNAAYISGTACLDSRKFTYALFKAAEKQGAKSIKGSVTKMIIDDNKILGIEMNNETLFADIIVLAVGPWMRQHPFDIFSIPISPLKGEILIGRNKGKQLNYHVYSDYSIIQKTDGFVWVGGTVEESGFDRTLTKKARKILSKNASKLVNFDGSLNYIGQTVCLRPISIDQKLIIGPHPIFNNVYIANGGGKKGILLGPLMGNIIANFITNYEQPSYVELLGPDRFNFSE